MMNQVSGDFHNKVTLYGTCRSPTNNQIVKMGVVDGQAM